MEVKGVDSGGVFIRIYHNSDSIKTKTHTIFVSCHRQSYNCEKMDKSG